MWSEARIGVAARYVNPVTDRGNHRMMNRDWKCRRSLPGSCMRIEDINTAGRGAIAVETPDHVNAALYRDHAHFLARVRHRRNGCPCSMLQDQGDRHHEHASNPFRITCPLRLSRKLQPTPAT